MQASYTCDRCGSETPTVFSELSITNGFSWCNNCYIEGWRDAFNSYHWHLNNLDILENRLKILREEVEALENGKG